MKRETLESRIRKIREEENDAFERGLIAGYLLMMLAYVAILG